MNKGVEELRQIATQIRIDIVKMLVQAGSGHLGGSLSVTDILVALYFNHMNIDPKNPCWEGRDYLILSKGHVCPALYAVLARAGYYPPEEMLTLRQLGGRLEGHPCKSRGLPGIEVSTGSLGQGIGVAGGIALGLKIDKKPNRVYSVNGDGELDEGSVWESVMSAGHYKLDNLTMIVDNNDLQIDGRIKDVMNLYPLKEKFLAFNWNVIECDGHDFKQLVDSLKKAEATKGKPTVIIAKTVKGKGVSFVEDKAEWHGKAPKPDEAVKALKELYALRNEVGRWKGATVELKPPKIAKELEALELEFAH
jgi:transketolase